MNSPLGPSDGPPLAPPDTSTSKTLLLDDIQPFELTLNPDWYTSNKSRLFGCSIAVGLLNQYGLRSAELLRITWRDVMENDTVLVRSVKRSRSRLIVIPGSSSAKVRIPKFWIKKSIFSCSYSQLEKYMIQRGYVSQPEGYRKRIITHLPRHNMAQSVARLAGYAPAGDVLGHKSGSSIMYYIPNSVPLKIPPVSPWTPVEDCKAAKWRNCRFIIPWPITYVLFCYDVNFLPPSVSYTMEIAKVDPGFPGTFYSGYIRVNFQDTAVPLVAFGCEWNRSYLIRIHFDYCGVHFRSSSCNFKAY